MSARSRIALLMAAALLVPTGCSTLPESGPVHREQAPKVAEQAELPYFTPPGPEQNGTPTDIASGFLRAMTATPLTSSVARKFLTSDAAGRWKPNSGTIAYSTVRLQPTPVGVDVELTVASRLDARGTWQPVGEANQKLTLEMTQEDAEWRISNPINQLIVPESYFTASYQRLGVYFFDQTDRALVSTPVFLPRGEQLATELVRSLLVGPSPAVADILHSAFPAGAALDDLSVVITPSGAAEVPVSKDILGLSADQLTRATAQLAWTLRQVAGVNSVQLNVAGSPVPLGSEGNAIPVTNVEEFNALADSTHVWGLKGGRLVSLRNGKVQESTGPFGRPAFQLRSLAVNERTKRVAAVSGNGRSLYVAGTEAAPDAAAREVLTGSDLLRPTYDALGRLWVVDRNRGRAIVWTIADGVPRRVQMPGVSGTRVVAISVSGEGARLAVARPGTDGPIVVVDLIRSPAGDFTLVGNQRSFSTAGPIQDIGWRNSDTLATLSADAGSTRTSFISSDGSTPDPTLLAISPNSSVGGTLVVSPDSALPLALDRADGQLDVVTSTGGWRTIASEISAATYSR